MLRRLLDRFRRRIVRRLVAAVMRDGSIRAQLELLVDQRVMRQLQGSFEIKRR